MKPDHDFAQLISWYFLIMFVLYLIPFLKNSHFRSKNCKIVSQIMFFSCIAKGNKQFGENIDLLLIFKYNISIITNS